MTDITIGMDTSTLAPGVGSTDVSGELATAGMAFGSLVQLVGKAVADTQTQLNKTAADSTSALAKTLVDMIAVQEIDYDDDGTITGSKTFTQKLPLIDYVDPVLYQWTAVNLQGRFNAQQFAAHTSSDSSSGSSTDSSGQAGVLLLFGGGYNNFQYDDSQVNVDRTASSDSSVGLLRMTAILEPRHDIGVPKPRSAVQGPNLSISAGPIVDVAATGTTPASRTQVAIVTFERPDATTIQDALVSITTDGVPWTYTNSAQTTTDANGQVSITLTRTFIDATADTTPIDVVVTARVGIVNNSTTLTF